MPCPHQNAQGTRSQVREVSTEPPFHILPPGPAWTGVSGCMPTFWREPLEILSPLALKSPPLLPLPPPNLHPLGLVNS